MVNAKTYSRRHRRPVHAIEEEPSTRKRSRKTLDSEPPRKRFKPSAESMSLFQTPHPSLGAQSQAYKLPSSQPRYSPGPLSPLPIAPVESLKENQRARSSASSTPWFKHSSSTLKSAARTRSETQRSSHFRSTFRRRKSNRSRSVSRSSSQSNSNSSSRASSKDPSHKAAYYPKSQLKHIVSLSSLDPLKDSSETKHRPKAKPKKQTSIPRPLSSPSASCASSPVAAHTTTYYANKKEMGSPPLSFTNSKKREALTEPFIDSNLPQDFKPTSRTRSHHRKSLPSMSQSARTSPEGGGDNDGPRKASKLRHGSSAELRDYAKRRHTRGENPNPLKRDLSQKRKKDRERRPSAPSSLLIPRLRPLPFRVSAPAAGNEEAPNSNAYTQKLCLASGLVVVPHRNNDAGLQKIITAHHDPQAVIPHLALQKRHPNSKDEDSDTGMAWMHTRSRVDFNRPPSQMEFLGPAGGLGPYGLGMGVEDPFLTSSDDDKASSDEAEVAGTVAGKGKAGRDLEFLLHSQGDKLDLDEERFGEDTWGVSTPFKVDNVQDEAKKQQVKMGLKNPAQDQPSQQLKLKHSQALTKRSNSLPTHGLGLLSSSSSGLSSDSKISPAPQLVRSKSQFDLRANDNEVQEEVKEEDDKEELPENDSGEDMDLTASATFGYLEANAVGAHHQHQDLAEEDMTPWITDSLISPPTIYLEMRTKGGDPAAGGETKAAGGGEQEEKTTLGSTTRLSSPFRLTSPAGLSTPFTEVGSTEEDEFEDQKGEAVIEKLFIQDGVTTNTAGGGTKFSTATTSKSSTRTRSGTIVPTNPVPPGARRTRSGTIMGPLAAPPAPAGVAPGNKVFVGSTRRTRSGTIVPNSSSATGAQVLPGDIGSASRPGGRARSGSTLKMKERQTQMQPRTASSGSDSDEDGGNRIRPAINKNGLARHTSSLNSAVGRSGSTSDPEFEFDADTEADVVAVECFADSLYVPRLGSSPDPIDFLRFASIEENDEDLPIEFAPGGEREAGEMKWCVAEETPSPDLVRKRGGGGGRFGLFGGLLGGRGHGKWSVKGKNKASKNLKARFMGVSGEEEEADVEKEGVRRQKKGKEKEMEDDELLLLPGETASLWV